MFQAETIVGVPFFNEEKHIRETCESLARQQSSDCIFLFGNNRSTDNSASIVDEFCRKDDRFKSVTVANQVSSIDNINHLIDMADCRYFSFMGAHDLISPGYVDQAVKVLAENKKVSIAFGMPYRFHKTKFRARPLYAGVYKFPDSPIARAVEFAKQFNDGSCCQGFVRRETLGDYRLKNIGGSDKLFVQRMLYLGNLHYLESERFYRRFFKKSANHYQNRHSVEKLNDEYLLESINLWKEYYDGPPELEAPLRNEFANALMKQDGIYLRKPPKLKAGRIIKGLARYLGRKIDDIIVG